MGEGEKFKGWVLFLTPHELFIPNFIKIGPLEQKFPKGGGEIPPHGGQMGMGEKFKGWVLFITPPELFIQNFIKIGLLKQKFPKGGKIPPHGG